MFIGGKYRLYPSAPQRETLAKHFGCSRWVYNWGLEQCQTAYKATGKQPRYLELQAKLPVLKQEHPWLQEGNAYGQSHPACS